MFYLKAALLFLTLCFVCEVRGALYYWFGCVGSMFWCYTHVCVFFICLLGFHHLLQVIWLIFGCITSTSVARTHVCALFVCIIWIISYRFIGYTSSVYRHTFLTVHIDAHLLYVLSGLWSCTGVFASDVYDIHSGYAFRVSAHFSPDFLLRVSSTWSFP